MEDPRAAFKVACSKYLKLIVSDNKFNEGHVVSFEGKDVPSEKLLAFFGDAYLHRVTSEFLITLSLRRGFPYDKGILTSVRSSLVCTANLAAIRRSLGYINPGLSDRTLATNLEALVGFMVLFAYPELEQLNLATFLVTNGIDIPIVRMILKGGD